MSQIESIDVYRYIRAKKYKFKEKTFRQKYKILKKSKYRCEKCGKYNRLTFHHFPYMRTLLALRISNVFYPPFVNVLCRECHILEHSNRVSFDYYIKVMYKILSYIINYKIKRILKLRYRLVISLIEKNGKKKTLKIG